jgi:ribonucleoside-diphosphate reductase alpha chain
MRISKIRDGGKNHTWDIEVERVHEYVLSNGAVSHNSTQGIDPIFSTTDTYESSTYTVKSMVPDFDKENFYIKAWDMQDNNNVEYMKLMAIVQKFICQGMSTNQYYDLTKLPGKVLDANRVKKDILTAYKYGLKSLYYVRTKDKENTSDNVATIHSGQTEEECAGCTI